MKCKKCESELENRSYIWQLCDDCFDEVYNSLPKLSSEAIAALAQYLNDGDN